MARQAVGWKVYRRGKALWVSWSGGGGEKVRKRLVDTHGGKIDAGTPARIINQCAATLYEAWCRMAEAPDREELDVIGLTDAFSRAHASGWKKLSIKNYALWMRNMEEFLGQETLLRSITPRRAEQLKQWLLARPIRGGETLSTRSVKDRMELYERMWEWAIRMEFADSNPFKRITRVVSSPTREKAPFTTEEVTRLLQTASEKMAWFYPVVLTIAVTGSRRGPIPFMEVRDLDEDRGTLKARDEISKRDKGQLYHLPSGLAEVLRSTAQGRAPAERLFLTNRGRPLGGKIFDPPRETRKPLPPNSRAWYRLQLLAGVRARWVHNLRRAGVTNLAEADVTMEKIASVTGQTPEVAREYYLSRGSAS
ncbi:tyrosine-type recombinase/integrase [bacterium]|nr:tyrosine-type recombinase/integrase [bacterium]